MCNVYRVQGIQVSPVKRRAWVNGVEVRLRAKEFDLLHLLIAHAGDVVSREQLMHQVWKTAVFTSTKTIDVHLGWLRRKLGDDAANPRLITTVRGCGLRFEPSTSAETLRPG